MSREQSAGCVVPAEPSFVVIKYGGKLFELFVLKCSKDQGRTTCNHNIFVVLMHSCYFFITDTAYLLIGMVNKLKAGQ